MRECAKHIKAEQHHGKHQTRVLQPASVERTAQGRARTPGQANVNLGDSGVAANAPVVEITH